MFCLCFGMEAPLMWNFNPPVILAHLFRNPPPPTPLCVSRKWLTLFKRLFVPRLHIAKVYIAWHFKVAIYSLIKDLKPSLIYYECVVTTSFYQQWLKLILLLKVYSFFLLPWSRCKCSLSAPLVADTLFHINKYTFHK